MARVYADVNQHMPKAYWEYDSVNITWGVLENYEVVRKIGIGCARRRLVPTSHALTSALQGEGNIPRSSKASMWSITKNASSKFSSQ